MSPADVMKPTSAPAVGLAGGIAAYLCWGLLPLYWRPLHQVPPLEILSHRIAWSLVFLAALLTARRQWACGLYGLLRKVAPLGSLEGLTLETVFLGVPAVGYLVWLEVQHQGHFAHEGWVVTSMLSAAGVVTAVPLLLFGEAARRLPLSVMGVLQFISPTMQLVLGIVVFRESFEVARWWGSAASGPR